MPYTITRSNRNYLTKSEKKKLLNTKQNEAFENMDKMMDEILNNDGFDVPIARSQFFPHSMSEGGIS